MLWSKTAYNVSQKIYDGVLRLMIFEEPQVCRVSEKGEFEGLEDTITPTGEIPQDEQLDLFQWMDSDGEKKARSERNSLSRAVNKVYDYGMCNDWEWFVTFTFDQEMVDRYDYSACMKKVTKWLDNQRQRQAPNLKYLLVPDTHKDGAFHFHGLMADCGQIPFVKSSMISKKGRKRLYFIGNKYDKNSTEYDENGINLGVQELKGGYRFGMSSASKIQGKTMKKSVGYMTKYITKNIVDVTRNRRKYLCSRNLNSPDFDKYYMYPDQIKKMIMMYRRKKRIVFEKTIPVDSGCYQNVIHLYEISISDLYDNLKEEDMELAVDMKNRVDEFNKEGDI